MKQVGVRHLKAHLSEVLRAVALGVPFEVTDRGRVVAELRPPGALDQESIYEANFRRMVREGKLVPASKPPEPGVFRPLQGAKLTEGSWLEILDRSREDRW